MKTFTNFAFKAELAKAKNRRWIINYDFLKLENGIFQQSQIQFLDRKIKKVNFES